MHSDDFCHWQRLFEETNTNSPGVFALRERVTLPPGNILPVFRLAIKNYLGNERLDVFLRFGFENPDTDESSDTILFSSFQADGGASAHLLSTATGQVLHYIPPRMSIYALTRAGPFLATWSIHVACRSGK